MSMPWPLILKANAWPPPDAQAFAARAADPDILASEDGEVQQWWRVSDWSER